MSVGKWLGHMDNDYYHHNHGFMGWVFCDLLDYYYGMSAGALFRERRSQSGLLVVVFVTAPSFALLKFSNSRAKWGDPIPCDLDLDDDDDLSEIDTTAEEFDAMWKEAEPVEIVTKPYDWADDDTMSAEETMHRFEALGPDTTTGPPGS